MTFEAVNDDGWIGRSKVTVNDVASGPPSALRLEFRESPGRPTGPIVLEMIRGPAAVTAWPMTMPRFSEPSEPPLALLVQIG